ncbi:MAG: deoxyribodipyrimidine photo-lyase [Anaerolineae bacterium]|nr:deoxyribodipyrimidine photo-lyase [Anaerolineae bacterium]
MATAIWWIRRDLRLGDNPTLAAALSEGYSVIPLFILDPRLLKLAAPKRKAFLLGGLQQLDQALRQANSRLVIRMGEPETVIEELKEETEAAALFAEEDYSPYATRRDERTARYIPFYRVVGATVHHPASVLRSNGEPYTVFTPFSKAWKALPFSPALLRAPAALPPVRDSLRSESLPEIQVSTLFPPGEEEAKRRLERFISGPIYEYLDGRNRLDLEGTSALSPYLRFGMISARQVALASLKAIEDTADPAARRSAEAWLNELIWREFFSAILYHFPHVLREAFNPTLRDIPWQSSPQDLEIWRAGLTGYPVVDAAMRQLAETGWMHNRGRMITASFLTKDLLINWQEGENWFMSQLVDGDPAANNGGWQWTAGVGTDAAPYFRVFNPTLQAKQFDPQGNYIRRWIPELADFPVKYIHTPWAAPGELLRKSGYPTPWVDHSVARNRALWAYSFAKENAKKSPHL